MIFETVDKITDIKFIIYGTTTALPCTITTYRFQ